MTIFRITIVCAFAVLLAACSGNGSTVNMPADHASSTGHTIMQSGEKWMIFPLPIGGSDPEFMTNGPGGNVWFTDNGGNSIDEIDVSTGAITRFPISDPSVEPQAIIAGADGNLWFCEGSKSRIGIMTPSGAYSSFPLPNFCNALAATRDGSIWTNGGNEIQQITSGGLVTQYPIPSGHTPLKLAVGADGNVWFTEQEPCPHNCRERHPFAKITSTGSITEYNWRGLPQHSRFGFSGDIVLGRDGLLYAIFGENGQVVRISHDGAGMLSPDGPGFRGSTVLVAGPPGVLYEISPKGLITRGGLDHGIVNSGNLPPNGREAKDMVFASDGNLWISQPNQSSIAVFLQKRITPSPTSISIGVGGSAQLSIREESYSRGWQVVSTNPAIATVAMKSSTLYEVKGIAVGTCSIVITDIKNNQATVPVTVN